MEVFFPWSYQRQDKYHWVLRHPDWITGPVLSERESARHRNLLTHFQRFINAAYPGVELVPRMDYLFLRLQTHGRKALGPLELLLVDPLVNAQELKEITLHTLVCEMAEWWSENWGWRPPLDATIADEFRERHIHRDRVYIKALIKLARSIEKGGFGQFFARFPGITNDYRQRIINHKFPAQ